MLNLLLLTSSVLAAGPQVEIHTLDKQVVTGVLAGLTADGATVQTADGEKTIALKQIMAFQPTPAPAAREENPTIWLELADGGRLTAKDFSVAKRIAKVTLTDGEVFEFPARMLRWVRFSASESKADAQWDEALKSKAGGDLLVVRKKDALDFLEGSIGNVAPDKVDFQLGGDPLEVKRLRVDGLIYVSSVRDLKDPVCQFEDVTGWRLPARVIEWEEGWKITTPAGVTLKRPAAALRKLDFSTGKVLFLSDLNWESAQTKSAFSLESEKLKEEQAPHRDRPPWGKELKINGQVFPKGLCLASRTQLVYRLPAGLRVFQCAAGIDDSMAKASARVRLRILADDKTVVDEEIRKGDKVRDFEVGILNVNRLTILVEHDVAAAAGRLTLGNARVQK